VARTGDSFSEEFEGQIGGPELRHLGVLNVTSIGFKRYVRYWNLVIPDFEVREVVIDGFFFVKRDTGEGHGIRGEFIFELTLSFVCQGGGVDASAEVGGDGDIGDEMRFYGFFKMGV
jgi:hypothetical protein